MSLECPRGTGCSPYLLLFLVLPAPSSPSCSGPQGTPSCQPCPGLSLCKPWDAGVFASSLRMATLSRLTPLQHPCSCTPTSFPGCRQAGHPGVQNFPHLRCSSFVKPLTWRKSFVPPACNKAPQANDSQCNVILWVLFSFCLLFHLLICFLFCLVFFEGSGVGSS